LAKLGSNFPLRSLRRRVLSCSTPRINMLNGKVAALMVFLVWPLAAGLTGSTVACGDGDADADGDGEIICEDECGVDNGFVADGVCQDVSPGVPRSVCPFGHDCTDCGPRRWSECTPDCGEPGAEHECGSDGCQGECGAGCTAPAVCTDDVGLCCTPTCEEGWECGYDGCGGLCGPGCGPNQICDDDGMSGMGTYWCFDCIPCPEGAQCGYDSCGNACGEGCAEGTQYCDEETFQCVDCGCPEGAQCGMDGCWNVCGAGCAEGTAYCDYETFTCVTCSCEGRECGDDGCGNACGSGCTAPECCNPTSRQCEAGTELCNDCCETAGDGSCDDGGFYCTSDRCAFGSDCADCGERTDDDRLPEGAHCLGDWW
jgi:hypothetical protein